MGIILDSSILVEYERRRFDLERLIEDHSPPAIAAITAAELLIGVERADTAERRARRSEFVENILERIPIVDFELTQARLYAARFADLVERGLMVGDRDLQIAVTALSLDYELATLNTLEFERIGGLKMVDVSGYRTS
jgi:predicted nucleic acid-binding protein